MWVMLATLVLVFLKVQCNILSGQDGDSVPSPTGTIELSPGEAPNPPIKQLRAHLFIYSTQTPGVQVLQCNKPKHRHQH